MPLNKKFSIITFVVDMENLHRQAATTSYSLTNGSSLPMKRRLCDDIPLLRTAYERLIKQVVRQGYFDGHELRARIANRMEAIGERLSESEEAATQYR